MTERYTWRRWYTRMSALWWDVTWRYESNISFPSKMIFRYGRSCSQQWYIFLPPMNGGWSINIHVGPWYVEFVRNYGE